jgi:hypothetical protein
VTIAFNFKLLKAESAISATGHEFTPDPGCIAGSDGWERQLVYEPALQIAPKLPYAVIAARAV